MDMSKNSGKDKVKNVMVNKIIVFNKCVCYEYYIEDCFEVGLVLQGWEVKLICVGCGNIIDVYVYVCDGEIYLIGVQIILLIQVFIYVVVNDWCECKLFLYCSEIDKLIGKVQCDGYIIVFIVMYWSKNKIKLEIVLVKGKQIYDKCDVEKDCDWVCEKLCIMCCYNCDV